MKHHTNVLFVLVLLLVHMISVPMLATQQKLKNEDVIKLVKAGLSPDLIVQTINSSNQSFDLSADGLITLKKEGVPDSVIQAMIIRSQGAGGNLTTPPAATLGNSGDATKGVILIDGTRRVQMKYSSPDPRGSGLFGNPLSSKVRSALPGNHSPLRITNTSPMFEIALPVNVHPSDAVAIVKLDVKADRREIEFVRAGITGSSIGPPKNKIIPVSLEEVESNDKPGGQYYKIYRVKLVSPIPPGEYALMGNAAQFYDFGVDANK